MKRKRAEHGENRKQGAGDTGKGKEKTKNSVFSKVLYRLFNYSLSVGEFENGVLNC